MEKKFTLEITEQELNILSAGLVKLPYEVVVELIGKLRMQVTEQSTQAEPIE
jgi:hypothetical protein